MSLELLFSRSLSGLRGSGLNLLVGLNLDSGVLLGLIDGDDIGKSLGDEVLTSDVSLVGSGKHDLDNATEHTLLHEAVLLTDGDELVDTVTGLEHVTLLELHDVSSLLTKLTRDDDLATLSASYGAVTDDGVGSTSDGKTGEKLELEGLSLSGGAKTTLHDHLGEDLDVVLGEVPSLVDDGSDLIKTAALLTSDILGVGGVDDDGKVAGGLLDFNTGVTSLSELTS